MTDEEWLDLLIREREARPSSRPNKPPDWQELRHWWAIWSEVFRELSHDQSHHRLPPELALIMSRLAHDLAAGHVPEPFTGVSQNRRGQKGPTWLEKQHIATALAYRAAANAGWISDRSPIQSIMQAYGLSNRTTVQKWVRDHKPRVFGSEQEAVALLPMLLLTNGAAYANMNNRTKAAIVRRARKRRPKEC